MPARRGARGNTCQAGAGAAREGWVRLKRLGGVPHRRRDRLRSAHGRTRAHESPPHGSPLPPPRLPTRRAARSRRAARRPRASPCPARGGNRAIRMGECRLTLSHTHHMHAHGARLQHEGELRARERRQLQLQVDCLREAAPQRQQRAPPLAHQPTAAGARDHGGGDLGREGRLLVPPRLRLRRARLVGVRGEVAHRQPAQGGARVKSRRGAKAVDR